MTVFLVQNPCKREGGQWVPKFDLAPAKAFGDLKAILPPGEDGYSFEMMPAILSDALSGARGYQRTDHLLALGNPVAIGLALHLCLKNTGGQCSVLKWDRIHARYSPALIDVRGLIA